MIAKRMDRSGVSPVIGVLLMLTLTVMLSGSVWLAVNTYASDAEGGPEIVNVRVSIETSGIREVSDDGTPTGRTYSGLRIEVISGTYEWQRYKVLVDGKKMFTVGSELIREGSVPDGNSEPAPLNYGVSQAGEVQWFTEDGLRSDLSPLMRLNEYDVRIVNLGTDSMVWQREVLATL